MEGKQALVISGAIVLAVIIAWFAYYYSGGLGQGNELEQNRGINEIEQRVLTISTTTSLYDTGLLDLIATIFKEETGIELHFIPKGTGAAINDAMNGASDGIIAHALSKELDFMEMGYGINRKVIAYNFFIIVGPEEDPAGISELRLLDSLEKIVEEGRNGNAIWVSRDDGSGTNTKEIFLWEKAGFKYDELREEDWFRSSGTGMGNTLTYCSNVGAYTLSDIGTYLKYSKDGLINLEVMVDKGEELINVYSIVAVNPEKWNKDIDGVTELTEWLISEKGQKIISEYGEEDYGNGEHLFYPVKGVFEKEPEIGSWIAKYGFIESDGKLSECPERFRYKTNISFVEIES